MKDFGEQEILNEMETFPLGDDEIEIISGIQKDAAVLQGRMIGVLDSFVKRNKLLGRWELAESGKEIRKSR